MLHRCCCCIAASTPLEPAGTQRRHGHCHAGCAQAPGCFSNRQPGSISSASPRAPPADARAAATGTTAAAAAADERCRVSAPSAAAGAVNRCAAKWTEWFTTSSSSSSSASDNTVLVHVSHEEQAHQQQQRPHTHGGRCDRFVGVGVSACVLSASWCCCGMALHCLFCASLGIGSESHLLTL